MKFILSLAVAASVAVLVPKSNPKTAPAFKDIEPIFQANCVACHSGDRARGGIDLTSYETVMKGGDDGPIVKAGAPKHSVLVQALRGMPGVRHMPPRSAPLPEDKIASVEAWILAGAKN